MGGRSRISPLKARKRRLSFPVLTAFKALSLIYLRFKEDVVGRGITGIKSFRVFYRGAKIFCEGPMMVFQAWGELTAHAMQSPMGKGNPRGLLISPAMCKTRVSPGTMQNRSHHLVRRTTLGFVLGISEVPAWNGPFGSKPSFDRDLWGRTGLLPWPYPQSCS